MAKATAKASKKESKAPAKTNETSPPPPAAFGELLEPFATLRRDIDHMFERFTRSFPSIFDVDPLQRIGPVFDFGNGGVAPHVEVAERDKAYEITAELPGVDEDDVKLTLQDGMLTLSGEKKAEHEEKKKGYYLSERSYGSFRRSFRMPEDVNDTKITAKFNKGIMTITLPKTAKAKAKGRSIPIQ